MRKVLQARDLQRENEGLLKKNKQLEKVLNKRELIMIKAL
jgi:hypothetical protein